MSRGNRASRVPALLLALAAGAVAGCDRGEDRPLERIGAPVAVAGAARDGGLRPPASEPDAGPSDAGGGAAEAEPVRAASPAEALEAAADGDRAADEGDLGAAAAAYDRAVEHDSGAPWLRVARAWLRARTGRLAEARADLEAALDASARGDDLLLAAAHLALGELQQARGDAARATESYRLALRARRMAPAAAALLGVLPASDPGRDEALHIALGAGPPWPARLPPRAWTEGEDAPGGALPLAVATLPDGRGGAVVARRRSSGEGLPTGWTYQIVLGQAVGEADAGVERDALEVGSAPAVRWHEATLEPVELGEGRQGLLATIDVTAPGAGAPSTSLAALVGPGPGGLALLLARSVGQERESPLGCRRGFRETPSLEDSDGDGEPDAVVLRRRDFVRARLADPGEGCEQGERTGPPRRLGLGAGRPPAEPPAPTADAGAPDAP